MKRLTKKIGDHYTYCDCNILCDQCFGGCKVSQEIIDRLGALENILENSHELSGLIEMFQNGSKVTEIKDCIEREVALKYLKSRKAQFVDDVGKGWNAGIDAAIEGIENLPAANVVTVQRGKWIAEEQESVSKRNRLIKYAVYSCSICGRSNGRIKKRYCPRCGALMSMDEVATVKENELV